MRALIPLIFRADLIVFGKFTLLPHWSCPARSRRESRLQLLLRPLRYRRFHSGIFPLQPKQPWSFHPLYLLFPLSLFLRRHSIFFSLAPFPAPCARSRANKPYTINPSSYLIVGIFSEVVRKVSLPVIFFSGILTLNSLFPFYSQI